MAVNRNLVLLYICLLGFGHYSCSNILEYESITPCGTFENQNLVRSWSNVHGLVRFDSEHQQFFIVARFPGEEDLSVLNTCNIPSEYLSDQAEIKFFGNEYTVTNDSLFIQSESRRKTVLAKPFEITFIERVVVY